VTLGCNFREDRQRAKQFLKAAAQRGADADYELRGWKALESTTESSEISKLNGKVRNREYHCLMFQDV